MNIKKLNELRYMNIELNRIDKQIHKMKDNDENSCFVKKYFKTLQDRKEEIYKQKIEIENYINKIEDAEIRLIILMRFVDLKSWEHIGDTLHYSRTSVFYKFKNYMETHKI